MSAILDTLPRTCRRSTLRRVRHALIPYRSKLVVFKPSVGTHCGGLFHLHDVGERRVKSHYTQQPRGRQPPKFSTVTCVDVTHFWKASAACGDVYIDLADRTRSAGRSSLLSTCFTFDGSDRVDPLRSADKLRQLYAQVAELQRHGIAIPALTIEVECFFTGDGKFMCNGHSKLKWRCWHCGLAIKDFGSGNLCRTDFVISIRRGGLPLFTPPTHGLGHMVHCCRRIGDAIFKRICSDGRISQACALLLLLQSVEQCVMQAIAHIA